MLYTTSLTILAWKRRVAARLACFLTDGGVVVSVVLGRFDVGVLSDVAARLITGDSADGADAFRGVKK